MIADLQKHQNQGTTEQHPGDLEKNVIFKETKAKRPSPGALVHPWSGEGKADKGRAGKSAQTGLLWAGKALGEGQQRALKAQPALQRLVQTP